MDNLKPAGAIGTGIRFKAVLGWGFLHLVIGLVILSVTVVFALGGFGSIGRPAPSDYPMTVGFVFLLVWWFPTDFIAGGISEWLDPDGGPIFLLMMLLHSLVVGFCAAAWKQRKRARAGGATS